MNFKLDRFETGIAIVLVIACFMNGIGYLYHDQLHAFWIS
jgi:hypothetical protein